MAERLSRFKPGPSLGALLLWLLPVLVAHVYLLQRWQDLILDWSEAQVRPMPPRMNIAFVRELKPTLTVPPSKPAAAPVKQVPKAAPPPAVAASAPPPEAMISAPEEPTMAASSPLEAGVPALLDVQVAEPAEVMAPTPSPAASASVAEPAFEPGPEWPPSTRLSYALTGNYRGAIYGSAQVEWMRQGAHYQMHMDVAVGPSFAPLISRRMSSDGQLTPTGIAPQRYDEDTRVLFSERRRSTLFFSPQSVTLANGRTEPAPSGTQDAASQFVQLTWLFLTGRETLQAGKVLELPLALPRRQYRWRYEVVGEVELQTPMGLLPTWHLRPSSPASGGDLTSEVWLAPSLQYLPVRLRIRQDEKSFVDLLLESPPLQATESPSQARAAMPAASQPSIVAPQVPDKEKP
ncbi:DUF3108 domain-containing protein [Paucibacter sp. Y2R2-4]|uniref:DUF3108 domain-containing protein n=1 Tax=Paucibacter sp. Y2R2-4 TaxID=2893553 RepID=UPI0021E384C5|nr:DUF3108 domain-containing protein [Paucibacter sp. Y2R2-4]MCV2349755.1 DUF3108 domain-containing protein [Paucibacter sp. Y2R2-4]